ncbi:MAG: S8/S53 family peptidase [Anaerolineae bacterium]
MKQTLEDVYDLGESVFADPNYALSGDLWGVGGDPWSIQSNLPGTSQQANDLFWEQWAFGDQGIRLFSNARATQRTVAYQGQGTRVAIFDTSPFAGVATGPSVPPTKAVIDWMLRTHLGLFISHPYDTPVTPPSHITQDCSDHGLFIAGLAHAVAPLSEIHLIRVLNQYAMGDMFTLLQALNWFINQSATLDKTVINLSLGLHKTAAADLPANMRTQIEALITSMMGTGYSLLAGTGDVPVMSLETTLRIAEGRGAVITAAVGNDSHTVPSPVQIPASYPNVIGVAASNMQGTKSCYSNTDGDIGAPGGDGGSGNGSTCVPQNQNCVPSADCPYGLISLASKPGSPSGYAYWVGTSFATPLASGLAALLLESGVKSDAVAGAITTGAAPPVSGLGGGIIDVSNTFPS